MPNEPHVARAAPVIVVGTSTKEIETLVPFGRTFAEQQRSHLLILGLVAAPPDESLSASALAARRLRLEIEPHARSANARVLVRVAHDIWRQLRDTVAAEKSTLVLFDWRNVPPAECLGDLRCPIALIKPPFPRSSPRILLPIRGGPFAALALKLALGIAQAQQGEITVLHVAPTQQPDHYENFLRRLSQLPQVTHWIHAEGSAIEAIRQAAKEHDLIAMGATAQATPGAPIIGAMADEMLNQFPISALVVRSARSPHPEPEPPPVDYTFSVLVDKWFAENTFHAREFSNLRALVELKEKQGLSISLALPTLNEEKTIGKIIRTLRYRLQKRFPLLDEIVVIDSDSTDHTVEIAQRMGVPVFRHRDILRECPDVPSETHWRGKGEALWKSLNVLRGDLIAWIDTDIVNIHPRFVYGILGPLIRNPQLVYVKGFYQRPLRIGGRVDARGGGRVTELVARPLFNLFYPELSGFVQPLAGEYAGRREALEQVPFFVGYGVETGLLIDLWSKYTLARMGQVDLEERIHRNQSLTALSKMAFEITQVILQRVGETRGMELVDDLNKSMKMIRYARDDFQLDIADIRARARPPMITVDEYRPQHRLAPAAASVPAVRD